MSKVTSDMSMSLDGFTFVTHANLKTIDLFFHRDTSPNRNIAVGNRGLAEEVYYYELQGMGFSNCSVKRLEYFYVDLGHYNRINHRYELVRTSYAT